MKRKVHVHGFFKVIFKQKYPISTVELASCGQQKIYTSACRRWKQDNKIDS